MMTLSTKRLFIFSLLVSLISSALTLYEFYGITLSMGRYIYFLRDYVIPISFAVAFVCVAFMRLKDCTCRGTKNVITLTTYGLFILVTLMSLVTSDLTMFMMFGPISSSRYYLEFLIGLLVPSALVLATICVIIMKQKLSDSIK